jgi:endonuclease/exonuclease/phosphatase family metal-dependent hydrolase
VFSTHTSGHACHARAVGALVRERRGELPGVLMGDLNAVESSEALATLAAEVRFLDAFRTRHPDAPGFTVYQPVTAPERRARRRVDYVLVVPGLAFPGVVVDSRVVLDAPGRLADGTLLWPSDHYGVLADLKVHPDGASSVAAQDGAHADPAGPGAVPLKEHPQGNAPANPGD